MGLNLAATDDGVIGDGFKRIPFSKSDVGTSEELTKDKATIKAHKKAVRKSRRRAIRARGASADDAATIAFEEEQPAAAREPVKIAVSDSDPDSDDPDSGGSDSGAAAAGSDDSDTGAPPTSAGRYHQRRVGGSPRPAGVISPAGCLVALLSSAVGPRARPGPALRTGNCHWHN